MPTARTLFEIFLPIVCALVGLLAFTANMAAAYLASFPGENQLNYVRLAVITNYILVMLFIMIISYVIKTEAEAVQASYRRELEHEQYHDEEPVCQHKRAAEPKQEHASQHVTVVFITDEDMEVEDMYDTVKAVEAAIEAAVVDNNLAGASLL